MLRTEIGDPYSFTPACLVAEPGGNLEMCKQASERRTVTGEIIQIHEGHHWIRVRYTMPGSSEVYYETFKTTEPPGSLPWRHGHRQPNSKLFTDITEFEE